MTVSKRCLMMICLILPFLAQAQEIEPPAGFTEVRENLLTGGQPSQADLLQLKNAGVTRIINLRTPAEEVPFDEQAEAEALGLEYVSLPVAGADGVTSENARRLDELLQGDEKTLLHCASGNRTGALLAIRAHEIEGESVEDSIQFGRAAGMDSLEARVRRLLDEEAP